VYNKKRIAIYIRISRREILRVHKGKLCKRTGNKRFTSRIQQSRILVHLKFNMGRDNAVIKKQIQLKNQNTSDKFIRKLIEIKENIWEYWEYWQKGKNRYSTSQETHYVSAKKPNRLMLHKETVSLYCENYTEHINTLCGHFSSYLIGNTSCLSYRAQPVNAA
jgi:hypothetical protein